MYIYICVYIYICIYIYVYIYICTNIYGIVWVLIWIINHLLSGISASKIWSTQILAPPGTCRTSNGPIHAGVRCVSANAPWSERCSPVKPWSMKWFRYLKLSGNNQWFHFLVHENNHGLKMDASPLAIAHSYEEMVHLYLIHDDLPIKSGDFPKLPLDDQTAMDLWFSSRFFNNRGRALNVGAMLSDK